MGDRGVPFDPKATCDICGEEGAYDFMGDLLCRLCLRETAGDLMDGEELEYEEEDGEE